MASKDPVNVLMGEQLQNSPHTEKSFNGLSKKFKKTKSTEKITSVIEYTCPNTCKFQCWTKISSEIRNAVNQEYYVSNKNEKKAFIASHIRRSPVKRRSKYSLESNLDENKFFRNNNFYYFLPDNSKSLIQVCKKIFFTTLGLKTNNTNAFRNTLYNLNEITLKPGPETAGGVSHSREKVEKRDSTIKNHIESFHPEISHYRREHAPNKRYLPRELSISFMYEDYLSKHPELKCSYEKYRSMLTDTMKISFAKLGHEECEECEAFNLHNPAHTKNNIEDSCSTCQNWNKHITRAKDARKLYRIHAEKSLKNETAVTYYSVDLEKVIMLPRLEQFKLVSFTPRLTMYNECFVPLKILSNGQNKIISAVWHESVIGRCSEQIISTYYQFFLECRDKPHVALWADNCSSQNKNWCLLSFLIYLINSGELETQIIDIHFFEVGHTFMSADSFHHMVERSMNEKKNLYDFKDFTDCVEATSKNVKLINMKPDLFYNWKDLKSQAKLNKMDSKPYLSKMTQIRVEKGKYTFKYRTTYNEEDPYIDIDFLQYYVEKKGFPEFKKVENYVGIDESKKNKILKSLLTLMPSSRKSFWINLPVSKTV